MAYMEKQVSSRPGINTVFTLSGSSQQTAAFGTQTYQIRVATSGAAPAGAAYLAIGANPTADTTGILIPGNFVDYFTVTPGQKIAVIQGGTAGLISVTEMS